MSDRYEGKCYGIIEEQDNGYDIDVTGVMAEYVCGIYDVGGFLSERIARDVLAAYCSRDVRDVASARSIAIKAISQGAYSEYKVVVKSIESVGFRREVIVTHECADGSYMSDSVLDGATFTCLPYTLFMNDVDVVHECKFDTHLRMSDEVVESLDSIYGEHGRFEFIEKFNGVYAHIHVPTVGFAYVYDDGRVEWLHDEFGDGDD